MIEQDRNAAHCRVPAPSSGKALATTPLVDLGGVAAILAGAALRRFGRRAYTEHTCSAHMEPAATCVGGAKRATDARCHVGSSRAAPTMLRRGPPRTSEAAQQRAGTRFGCHMNNEPTQPCPFCDEPVRLTARACRYCGQDLKAAPSATPLHAPSDTAAWLELFTQPEVVTPATEPLIKPLRYRRSRREIVATGPRTIGEAVQGITNLLGLDPGRHQELLRTIVKDCGIAAAWAVAREVRQLPPRRRRRAFFERVRHTQAPPDAA
jgi:hypothetical protein